MMLYPPLSDLVTKVGSRYLLVNLVSKRARHISTEAENNETPLTRKPVSIAIDEVFTGKLTATESEKAAADGMPVAESAEETATEPAAEPAEDTL